jgi:hypothetical protein
MHPPKTPHHHPKPAPPQTDCCVESECRSGLRNNYFVGKRLTPDALRVEQAYLNERRHLLNRAVHGWGVVYGYPVKGEAAGGRIVIGPGLALDELGRELLWDENRALGLADVIGLDESGAPFPRGCKDATTPWHKCCWLLSVHYAERDVDQVPVSDPCRCERHQWEHVCETVRFSLQRVDCGKCCKQPECELRCECGTGHCCDERRKEECGHETKNPVLRGGCQCLCEHLTHLEPGAGCRELTEIVEPCGRVRVDLHNGVPLACVGLTKEGCEDWKFDQWIEGCGPRRLVKRNDLLFDLIQGCDLTRIAKTGWERFHRQEGAIPYADFMASWGECKEDATDQETQYWVEFSRPVRASTVRPDCFAITVIVAEEEGGWGQMLRVPITRVTLSQPGGPPGHALRAHVWVDACWVRDAIVSQKCQFNYTEAIVEVEVRGDFIIDCNGQAVDAEPVGTLPVPTGDGTPGGRYLSPFRVAARRGSGAPNPGPYATRTQGGMS